MEQSLPPTPPSSSGSGSETASARQSEARRPVGQEEEEEGRAPFVPPHSLPPTPTSRSSVTTSPAATMSAPNEEAIRASGSRGPSTPPMQPHEGPLQGVPPSLPPTPPSTASPSPSAAEAASAPSRSPALVPTPSVSPSMSTRPPQLSEAEQRAVLAVEEYQSRVRAKLLSDACGDSAFQVSSTLQHMITEHHSSTEQLHGENEVLRAQLLKATGLIEQLSDRLSDVKALESSWSGQKDTATTTIDADMGTDANNAGKLDNNSSNTNAMAAVDTRAMTGDSPSLAKPPTSVLPSLSAHDGVLAMPSPSALAALLADYHKVHGIASTLEGEQRRWRQHFLELSELLTTVTEENTRYRQEIARLKATTVSITQYQDLAQDRDRSLYQLEALRLETAKLAEQLDLDAQLREMTEAERDAGGEVDASGLALASRVEHAQESDRQRQESQPQQGNEEGAQEPPPPHHTGLWSLALREVEEQAALAANHAATRDRLVEAEARLMTLSTDNANMTAALAALREEDEHLRQDAQALTFRNGVLSQQVASLLVKCENLRRALKDRPRAPSPAGETHSTAHPQDVDVAAPTSDLHATVGGNASGSSSNGAPRRSHSAASPLPLSRRLDSIRGASVASNVWQSRLSGRNASAREGNAHGFSHVTQSPTSRLSWLSSGRRSGPETSAVATDGRGPGRVGMGADVTLPPQLSGNRTNSNGTSSETLLNSATLNIPASPSTAITTTDLSALEGRQPLPTVEVEHGVGRSMAAYSSRRREVTLRNFGLGRVDVNLPCEPRLPASQQLSGVALGRPSAYATLDPVRGTVQRHASDAELTLVRSSAATSQLRGTSSREAPQEPTATLISEVGEEENNSFLDMLDMVEADDKLDRFSVNSVAELVVRNQELVQQLYETAQKKEQAETALAHTRRSSAKGPKSIVSPLPAENADGLVRSSASSEAGRPSVDHQAPPEAPSLKRTRSETRTGGDTSGPAGSEEGPATGTASTSHSSGAFTTRISAPSPATTGAAAPRDEASSASVFPSQSDVIISSQVPGEAALTPPQQRADAAERMRRAPWAHAVLGPRVLTESVEDTVKRLISAVLEQHESTVTRVDEGLSASLLQLLETKAISAAGTPQQRRASFVSDASNALLESLVALCTSQAVTLAQQAVAMAAAEKSSQAVVLQRGWEQAQQLLAQTTEELKDAILRHQTKNTRDVAAKTNSAVQTAGGSSRESVTLVVSEDASDLRPPALGPDDGLLGTPVNLTHMHSLLETAAAKEDTVQRVHMVSQERQRAFLLHKERKLAKLAARTERAAAMLADMIAQQQRVNPATHRPPSASPLMQPLDSLNANISGGGGSGGAGGIGESLSTPNSNLVPSMAMTSTASPLPQSLSGAHRALSTSGGGGGGGAGTETPPVAGPPFTGVTDPLLLPGVRTEGTGAVISQSPFLVVTDDSEEDDADDDVLFGDLKNQLALAQAQSERLARELNTEKAAHMELYERMWRLEIERDGAVKEREDMATVMQDMLTREEYERVIADLDEANGGIADREAQLSHAQEENSKLLTEIDLLKEQLSSHQQRREHANAAKNDEIARQARELEEQNRRYGRLYAQNRQLEEVVEQLRKEAQVNAVMAADDSHTIQDLKNQLAQVREQFLSSENTQAVLLALYPGDSVLAAHTALVRDLRKERAALEVKLHEANLRARQAEDAATDMDAALRRAVQERQAAELQLQEVLLRHASAATARRRAYKDPVAMHQGATAEGGGGEALVSPAHDTQADDAQSTSTRSDELQAVGGEDWNSDASKHGRERSDAEAGDGEVESSEGSTRGSGRHASSRSSSGEDLSGSELAVHVHTALVVRREQQRLLAELQATVESQEREIARLQEAERAWQAREADLRRQLDLLGRDPISETARKYGLTACASFEAQIQELSEVNDALQESVDALTKEKAELRRQLVALQDNEQENELKLQDMQSALDSAKVDLVGREEVLRATKEELASLETEHAASKASLEQCKAELATQQSGLDAAQRRLQDTERTLQQCRADREKFFHDNRALISRIEDLQRDLTKADEEKRAANAALSQGMLAASRASAGPLPPNAGGPARHAPTARRLLRSASAFMTSPAGEASSPNNSTVMFSGNVSLTGDMSTTPTGHPGNH